MVCLGQAQFELRKHMGVQWLQATCHTCRYVVQTQACASRCQGHATGQMNRAHVHREQEPELLVHGSDGCAHEPQNAAQHGAGEPC